MWSIGKSSVKISILLKSGSIYEIALLHLNDNAFKHFTQNSNLTHNVRRPVSLSTDFEEFHMIVWLALYCPQSKSIRSRKKKMKVIYHHIKGVALRMGYLF